MNARLAKVVLLVLCAALAGPSRSSAQMVTVQPPVSSPLGEEFTVSIVLDTGGIGVLGLEVSLSFDATIVQLIGIDPGPWFTAGDADYFFWDYTHAGTELIHFSASRLGSAEAVGGEVAVCRFTALKAGVSLLDFLGVEVRDFQNQNLFAGHSSGDKIIIDEAVETDRASFGGVKSLFR